MTKKELNVRLANICAEARNVTNGATFEKVNMWMDAKLPNVFAYAATSERTMESNLARVGKKRNYTFMQDLSIAEWYGHANVLDTVKTIVRSWNANEKAMAEFVLSVNFKSWEHDARGNEKWCEFYSYLYEQVRDLVYDLYENDEDKAYYVFSYLN